MLLCGAMIVVALAVVLITGNPVAALPIVGCLVMMALMGRLMGGRSPP